MQWRSQKNKLAGANVGAAARRPGAAPAASRSDGARICCPRCLLRTVDLEMDSERNGPLRLWTAARLEASG
jgi:hypothetical protein